MKKMMVSQPLRGYIELEIVEARERARKFAEEQGYEFVNSLFVDDWYEKENLEEKGVKQIPVYFLSKSIEKMSLCDVVYFSKGYENARGCRAEYAIAKEYGLEIIIEE